MRLTTLTILPKDFKFRIYKAGKETWATFWIFRLSWRRKNEFFKNTNM